MKADNTREIRHRRILAVTALLLCTLTGAGIVAQTADFEQLLQAKLTTALLEHDGVVIGGIEGGGLVFWQAADPTQHERLSAGSELSGNDVTDLVWTGRHVWVATHGGGLTRITDVAGQRSSRQYASNLGSLEINAVTGVLRGGSERVYYGMDGGGVGLITDGLSGAVYTAEQDDLISNEVNTLQVLGGDLFVGTPVGVSRFANNLFTDQNAGLGNLEIHDLALDSDGNLLAGTQAGVHRWDPGSATWSLVGGDTATANEISCKEGLIYVRGNNVRVYNGTSWRTLSAPAGATGAIYAGDRFWLGGSVGVSTNSDYTVLNAYVAFLSGTTTFDVFELTASQIQSAAGVAFSGESPQIGAQIWQSVISGRQDDTWRHIYYEAPTSENQNTRLSEGVILSMTSGPDNAVWAGLYAGTGLARIDPAAGTTTLINPANSGLQGKGIVNVVVHPDGTVLTLHDWSDDEKVEILVDPENWADAASWMVLPLDMGLGDGPSVWDAVVQRNDVIWFAVEAAGLVRWDINGDLAGPDDPLTWLDQSDDRWDGPISGVPGSTLDLGATFGLEVGDDGSIWAGGNGLLQFSYDERIEEPTKLTSISEKVNALVDGLVNGNVSDIVRDVNGHIWVATASGINRVRGSGDDVEIDTYIDLPNYFTNPNYAVLYSPNVISPLPGNTYRKITASVSGELVLVSADQGASVITVERGSAAAAPTLETAYLFPNPYTGEGVSLKIGGLAVDATARVDIFNLEGQLVYTDSSVLPETGFWSGTNRSGINVSPGLYVVRITSGGAARSLTLAVVR